MSTNDATADTTTPPVTPEERLRELEIAVRESDGGGIRALRAPLGN